MQGRVTAFDQVRGFGWIQGEDGATYFCHALRVCTDVNGLQVLYPDDVVEFELIEQGPSFSKDRVCVTQILSPIRTLNPPPYPRETGHVTCIHQKGSGFATRAIECSGIFLSPRTISALNLKPGDWISFEPREPWTKIRNGRLALWHAYFVRRETPKHTLELEEEQFSAAFRDYSAD